MSDRPLCILILLPICHMFDIPSPSPLFELESTLKHNNHEFYSALFHLCELEDQTRRLNVLGKTKQYPFSAGLSARSSRRCDFCRAPWLHRSVFSLNITSKPGLLHFSSVAPASQARYYHKFCPIYFSFCIKPNL